MLHPDELFDPIDSDPIVPDKLLDRSLKYLPSLTRVDVERKRGANSWKKVNGFKVEPEANTDGDAAAEHVSAMIVMMAQSNHDEDGGVQHYRAKYHIKVRGGKIQRKTFAFKMSDDSDEVEPSLEGIEQQEVLAVAFDRAIALINVQTTHIENLNSQMLSQAQTQAGQTAPLLQTIETLVTKYHEGLAMQANAVQAIAEVERGAAEIERKSERDKALLDIVALALPKAMDQLGNYMRRKTGAPEEEEVDPDESEGENTDSEGQVPPPKPQPTPETTQPEEPEMQNPTTIEDPLTLFAHAFRDSILSEQWLALSEVMTKVEMKLLRDAVSQENDEATSEGILAFKDGLRPAKYLKLNRILDEEQREMVMKLLDVIDANIPDDDDDEGEA